MSSPLPLTTKFRLGPTITPEQRAFLDQHGFLHFERVAAPDEVAMITSEMERIQSEWAAAGRTRVYGIPLFWGKDEQGQPFLQRLAFTSVFSDSIRQFVRDPRFRPILELVGADARIGDAEKDGVVINRYLNIPGSVYPRLGWHTDGLRDLFYGRMPLRMLNIGLHLDRCTRDNGGLRLIPGSQDQGFWSMCFRKLYFLSHAPDPAEICVETEAGDLTVHDGRLWHRVAQSEHVGRPSLRRSMYLPYLTGPYEPKSDDSTTPAYHRIGEWLRGSAPKRA
jgi:phytanoyl-CoA hydroxylase